MYHNGPQVPELRAITGKVIWPRPVTQVHYIHQSSGFFVVTLADPLPIPLQSVPDVGPKRFKPTVKSVSIDVTDQFEPRRPLKPMRSFPPSVRHVDTSGRPQFSVSEERVIGLNESRAVLKDFTANGGLDIVPVEFRKLAESLLCSYQRAITRKASVRAILCDRGNSAGALPTVLKPNVVRQVNHQYTYNWFLVEYMTLPPSRQPSERIRRNSTAKRAERARSMQQEHEDSEDSGCLSSHSIEFGCL